MALRLPAVMRTTAARLSALYLVLFTACAVLLVIYMTTVSVRILEGQTRETINEEAQNLASAYQRGGLTFLVRVVEQRARQPGANLYLIADPDGRILSGNVDSLDAGVLAVEGWTDRPFMYKRYGEAAARGARQGGASGALPGEAAPAPHQAIALVLRLPNQMILLVGRDLGEPERFRRAVSRALIFAFVMMGCGAFAIWFLVGRAALKRIDKVSEAGRRIMGGDLAQRLPVSGAGDEFDRLSDNLNGMLARIGELNEGLKQVSDNVAHDLRTPLTRLRNRAEAALASGGPEATYRAALEATIAESDQLIRVFNAILMISQLEAGSAQEMTSSVDLAAIAADVVDLYEPAAEEASVELSLDIRSSSSVAGNRELIGQSLSNIVDNALKYARSGGLPPVVRVSLDRDGPDIRLAVEDNGPGIPEAERERATERFVRLEKSRSQPGSGLGLSLAKAVMHFHGGRLELSGRDPGLSVAMVFPASRD